MSEGNGEVLDYLRESFARVHVRFDKVDRQLHENSQRFGRLETNMVQIKPDMAEFYAHLVSSTHQIEGLGTRLDRIERRLDLVGSP